MGIGNSSYKSDRRSISGVMFVLMVKALTLVSSLCWQSKHIEKVPHLSKDTDMLNFMKMVDDLVNIAHQLEMLYFGNDLR